MKKAEKRKRWATHAACARTLPALTRALLARVLLTRVSSRARRVRLAVHSELAELGVDADDTFRPTPG
jgi:hypothetical protein